MSVERLREEHSVELELATLETDPYPIYARLQAEQPLAWVESLQMWLVTRYADVTHMLAHPELFTAETEPSFLKDVLGVTMLSLEGDAAKRVKRATQTPFTAAGRSKPFVRDELAAFAHQLVDSFIDDGRVELMSAYAEPLSTWSLQRVLGLDDIPVPKMWDLCQGLCAGIANFEGSPEMDRLYRKARRELDEILRARIALARRSPDESAIAYFAGPKHGLSDDEIVNNVSLMISGGINEPRDGIGMVTYAFLTHYDSSMGDLDDRNACLKFINETLRLYSPVGTAARMTTRPAAIAGVELPAGEFISACLAAANVDAGFWDRPGEFVPDRSQKDHVAFSQGQHRCLGLWLALQEILVGFSVLRERLPGMRLDADRPPTISGFEFRGPKQLQLYWQTHGSTADCQAV